MCGMSALGKNFHIKQGMDGLILIQGRESPCREVRKTPPARTKPDLLEVYGTQGQPFYRFVWCGELGYVVAHHMSERETERQKDRKEGQRVEGCSEGR